MAAREHKVSYKRHSLPVRVMHWINFVALTVMLASGLQIFNAHPSLYWGKSSYNGKPPILDMRAEQRSDGEYIGVTQVFGRAFETTGLFGLSNDSTGSIAARGFPTWATLPSDQWLASARRWHFFFSWIFVLNGLAYVTYAVATRHLRRDLAPNGGELRGIGRSVLDHLRFRHPQGEAARHYNVLQKLTYLFVIFVLLPFTILMGLAMSPKMNSLLPGWIDLFGGRQSARTLHFTGAFLILLFVLVHVFEVLISGVWNNIRSMITGRYDVTVSRSESNAAAAPKG